MSNTGRRSRIEALIAFRKKARRVEREIERNKHFAGQDYDREMFGDVERERQSTRLRLLANELERDLLSGDTVIVHKHRR